MQHKRIEKYSIKQARRDLPKRALRDNKTRGGKCLIIAGSNQMWGAAILCLKAAARSGAGYTYLFDPSQKFLQTKHPDFLTVRNFKDLSQFQALAIGPGFKKHKYLEKYIRFLVKKNIPVVLDAEGLNVLAKFKKIPRLPANWILTPHEGELSRLLNVSSKLIRSNRKEHLQRAQKKFGCTVVLKGNPTLICNNQTIWKNTSGNPALAKAGTGDVLTGLIAGLLSQKMLPAKAACLGVYLHGLIADQWILKGNDQLSLLATDLITYLPKTLSLIRRHQ